MDDILLEVAASDPELANGRLAIRAGDGDLEGDGHFHASRRVHRSTKRVRVRIPLWQYDKRRVSPQGLVVKEEGEVCEW